MSFNADDECEDWLLGAFGLSSADIALGVILNKLALLGLNYMFWSIGKRKFVRKFFKQIKQRPAFAKAVAHLGLVDPPSVDLSKTIEDNGGGAGNGNGRVVIPSEESIEVLNVLLKTTATPQNSDERTWHDLWK